MRARAAAGGLVTFVGPSLAPTEARRLGGGTVLPPARQGDVWRALASRPRAIALIDGVFEAQPSVWHREILSALGAGVAVFGASSMGALRAAELAPYGMVGVGQVFAWVAEGVVEDDAEVALLHAEAEHGYRPLTVPLVTVRHLLAEARAARVLTAREGAQLWGAARRLFYQERTWAALTRAVERAWPSATCSRFAAFRKGVPDIKRTDAERCLAVARAFVEARPPGPSPVQAGFRPSSAVRGRRVLDGASRLGRGVAPNAHALAQLQRRPDAGALAQAHLTRAVLAALARSQGLTASPEEVADAERGWLARLGASRARRLEALAALGMDAEEAARLCADEVLAHKALALGPRLIPDAPGPDEALAQEARWQGLWPKPGTGEAT